MWERSGSFEFDNNGVRAPGAKAFFYDAGTSTPRATYSDAALSVARTHPVLADGNGRWPAVFLQFGSYKLLITTSGGETLFNADNIPNEAPTDPTDSVDPNSIFQTGDIIFLGANATRAGFVRWNGRTIGSATSGATERANSDCEAAFLHLWNNFANGQCAVSAGRGATAAADWAANKTIALPSARSAALIGFDDMGNTAAGLAASAPVVSGSAILAGSIIGANTHTLSTAELASHLHNVGIVSAGQSIDHTHGVNGATGVGGTHNHTGTTDSGGVDHTHSYNVTTIIAGTIAGGGSGTQPSVSASNTGNASAFLHTHAFTTSTQADHTHNINITSGTTSTDHTHLVSGNTANTGSGTAHNTLQRSIPVTVLMKL